MSRPRLVLAQALQEDLRPMVQQLREAGWPAEVWMVKDDDKGERFHIDVRVYLDVPVPTESEVMPRSET